MKSIAEYSKSTVSSDCSVLNSPVKNLEPMSKYNGSPNSLFLLISIGETINRNSPIHNAYFAKLFVEIFEL